MMRVGKNPAKALQTAPQPARVTVAIITYVPFLRGYYAQSLDVLKVCLNSLWQNTREPYDLLVFDNASCAEVRAYLGEQHRQGRIQYLTLVDRNIGKAGAWNFIFGAAPGEVIAYADSDVRFFPGWLRAHLDVLEAFPNVGMVTGMPMWSPEEFSTATLRWAEQAADVEIVRGFPLPWEDYWRHARSLGMAESEARQRYADIEVIALKKGDHHYYLGAAHFQFVSPKAALQSVLPIPSRRLMGEVRLLDIAIDRRGYLRVSTPEWWVQHLGNRLTGEEIPFGETAAPPQAPRRPAPSKWWLRRGPGRKLLYWLYHRLFELLEG